MSVSIFFDVIRFSIEWILLSYILTGVDSFFKCYRVPKCFKLSQNFSVKNRPPQASVFRRRQNLKVPSLRGEICKRLTANN